MFPMPPLLGCVEDQSSPGWTFGKSLREDLGKQARALPSAFTLTGSGKNAFISVSLALKQIQVLLITSLLSKSNSRPDFQAHAIRDKEKL